MKICLVAPFTHFPWERFVCNVHNHDYSSFSISIGQWSHKDNGRDKPILQLNSVYSTCFLVLTDFTKFYNGSRNHINTSDRVTPEADETDSFSFMILFSVFSRIFFDQNTNRWTCKILVSHCSRVCSVHCLHLTKEIWSFCTICES